MKYSIITKIKDYQFLISLEDIKAYLRITGDYDDQLLKQMHDAAIDMAENYLGNSLTRQVITVDYEAKYFNKLDLPITPAEDIEQLMIIFDEASLELTKDSDFILSQTKRYVVLTNNYRAIGARIKYNTTAKQPEEIPWAIIEGLLLHIAEMYEHQGIRASIPQSSIALYEPYKKIRI